MNTIGQHLCLTRLADSHRRVAALRLAPVGPLSLDQLQTLDLAPLAALLPCIVVSDSAPVFAEEPMAWLVKAGCTCATADTLARLVSPDSAPLPAKVRYVTGDWYLQPLPKPLPQQTASRALALKLAKLVATDADTFEIENIFRHEPTLSYNLLRLVNSPGMGTGRRIDSLAQAIMILGRRQLRRWLNLLLFSSQRDDPRAPLLLAHVTVRARLLEQLAHECGWDKDQQERAFMAGMFSLLGVMFGMPLPEVLLPLNLDSAMTGALLRHEGELGALLALAEALEHGDATAALPHLHTFFAPSLSPNIDQLIIDAHVWMLGLLQSDRESARG